MNARTQIIPESFPTSLKVAGARLDFDRHAWRLAARPRRLLLKRLLDLVIAPALLVLLSPLFVVAAIAVKFSSRGPVFFRQEREGRNGRRFLILKFRSMRMADASERKGLQTEADVRGALLKMRRDPRVTRVGRWLRQTSLDELPQLFNVLRGEMSLVGPRPLIPFMLEAHPEFRRVRALLPPGITGLWQLRDRANNTTAAAMVLHDLEYLERFSVGLDLIILLRTLPAVATGRGAF